MECEMCGKKVATRRYMVDKTVMNLGLECSKYGSPLDGTAAPGTAASMHQNLERRAARDVRPSVFDAQGSLVLVSDYGVKIHKAREAKGMSHEQLGNKVSARVPELKHIEAGKLRPSDDVTKKLEKELGITLMEKVEGPAPVLSGQKKAGLSAGLTIGDLLRDAVDKKAASGKQTKPAPSSPAKPAGKK